MIGVFFLNWLESINEKRFAIFKKWVGMNRASLLENIREFEDNTKILKVGHLPRIWLWSR